MSDFVEVSLDDNTTVLFQAVESDLVQAHGGKPTIDQIEGGMNRLETIATATEQVSQTFRNKVAPDEIVMEIGIGLSGEVGWFFAKSHLEASLKATLTWKAKTSE